MRTERTTWRPPRAGLPVAEIGRLAAERMLARLGGKSVPRVEEVKVELVVRASTGPPH